MVNLNYIKARAWIAGVTAANVILNPVRVLAEGDGDTGETGPGGETGLDQYNIFPDLSGKDAKSSAQSLAQWGYQLFFLLGCLFFGVKVLTAFAAYVSVPTDSHHESQKKELFSEMLEPLKGLMLMIVGGWLFNMLLKQFGVFGGGDFINPNGTSNP